MKKRIIIVVIGILMASCGSGTKNNEPKKNTMPVSGTWKLISGTLIEKNDTTITDYTKNLSFIKIINENHFAFLEHDLKHGKDSSAVFVAGGGRYSIVDSVYTEHLEYCNDRDWEGNDFSFVVIVKNDTLIQRGIEKVEKSGINRLNIEKYVKFK
jgi:predicted small secreted protein